MIHNLKTLPEYFKPIREGYKTFEVRKNDRNYQVGDTLILEEWNPEKTKYTSNLVEAKVLYILNDPQFVKEGYVIMGIEVD